MLAMFGAVSVALPKPGETLPPVSRTYITGAASRGTASLTVQGEKVEIHPRGGWVAIVDVATGVNDIEIEADGFKTNIAIKVAAPSGGGRDVPPPVYGKIPYAKDDAKAHPLGKAPGEITIAIDPGHGGPADTGTVSPHGYYEKDANLALAREVRRALEALGYNVKMTRESDVAVPLQERARIACGKNGADAFVSIHHNSCAYDKDPRQIRYTCVYKWNDIGNALAECISGRMAAALEGDIESRGVLHANFLVTRNPEVPSCLVEADFINSPEGELASWNGARRLKLAKAIAAGIDDWCQAR